MRTLVPVLALASACRSSAPYTIPSAVINSALAVGASTQRRAEGDCFSVCPHGTICNPRTGYCEPAACGGQCQPWEVCVESETGSGHCAGTFSPAIREQQRSRGELPVGTTPDLGVSPATGRAPSSPTDKPSPDKP